jgi:hypothetical protein
MSTSPERGTAQGRDFPETENAHPAGPTPLALDSGEILLLPAELWPAIDEAIETAGAIADGAEARGCFGRAFVEALHKRGLILVPRARSASRVTVDAELYSLALSGKHEAEERLGWLRKLALGSPDLVGAGRPLVDVAGDAILSLAGRAPPGDGRHWAELTMLRLRGAAAILAGKRDLSDLPAFSDTMIAFLKGETP